MSKPPSHTGETEGTVRRPGEGTEPLCARWRRRWHHCGAVGGARSPRSYHHSPAFVPLCPRLPSGFERTRDSQIRGTIFDPVTSPDFRPDRRQGPTGGPAGPPGAHHTLDDEMSLFAELRRSPLPLHSAGWFAGEGTLGCCSTVSIWGNSTNSVLIPCTHPSPVPPCSHAPGAPEAR